MVHDGNQRSAVSTTRTMKTARVNRIRVVLALRSSGHYWNSS